MQARVLRRKCALRATVSRRAESDRDSERASAERCRSDTGRRGCARLFTVCDPEWLGKRDERRQDADGAWTRRLLRGDCTPRRGCAHHNGDGLLGGQSDRHARQRLPCFRALLSGSVRSNETRNGRPTGTIATGVLVVTIRRHSGRFALRLVRRQLPRQEGAARQMRRRRWLPNSSSTIHPLPPRSCRRTSPDTAPRGRLNAGHGGKATSSTCRRSPRASSSPRCASVATTASIPPECVDSRSRLSVSSQE
jgi:hypothetical protein